MVRLLAARTDDGRMIEVWADCVMKPVKRLRLESDEPVPYQLDGDPGGFLPVDLEVLPGRLTLIVPQLWAEQQGLTPQ